MNEVSNETVLVGGSNGVGSTIVQYRVPFYEAAKRYLTKPTSKGRSSRSEFWWGLLFSFVLDLGLDGLLGGTIIYSVCALAILVFDIFLWWRRMQDLGKSGWWCIVPIYNLYLAAQPSEKKENKYGPVPNMEPIREDMKWRNIVVGIVVACVLSWLISGCFASDAPEDAVQRLGESMRDKDAFKFCSAVYMEDMSNEKFEADKDLFEMIFNKMMQDEDLVKFGMMMCDAEIIDVVKDDDGACVQFVPRDENLRADIVAEGFAGLMVKVLETDDGWKVDIETIRPIFATKK